MQPPSRKLLLRLAVKLQAALDQYQQQTPAFELPSESWDRCQQLATHIRQAQFFNWQAALSSRRKDLETALDRLRIDLHLRQNQLKIRTQSSASLRDLLLDLSGLYQEFDAVEFDLRADTLSVTTEPITLDDHYFGPFSIELNWQKLGATHPYRVLALEPSPAARDDSITHPHVQDQMLCEGDGQQAIAAALASGRLYDYFCLIANVLRNYNESSPYVAISEWSGTSCSNCGGQIDDDDSTTCSRCEDTVCDECSYCCHACGDYHCSNCTGNCSACQESTCRACLESCNECGESICSDCLTDNHLCESCHNAQDEPEPTPVGVST